MKTQWVGIVFCILILAACAPSADVVSTAIAQTEAAKPTTTPTANSTNTPLPSATATTTNTVTPSPTPDVRVIDIDPRKLLLQKSDLPAEGKYILPSGWTSPLTNAEIVAEWTVEEGRTYLAETGRVHGWMVDYLRGTDSAVMPEEIYDNVVLYSSREGAQVLIAKYGITDDEDGYKEIDAPKLGDVSRVYTYSETDASGGTRVWLRIYFCHRNVCHNMILWGWEEDVSLDFGVKIATKLIDGLKQLPLSDTVTFSPKFS